jgi:hypothetical protein
MRAMVCSLPFFALNALLFLCSGLCPAIAENGYAQTQRLASLSYGGLPLSFEENQGQTDSRAKFLSRGKGYNLFLKSTEMVLSISGKSKREERRSMLERYGDAPSRITGRSEETVRMTIIGANRSARIAGLDRLPGKSSYFIGKDPAKWLTDIPHYAKVRIENIYPKIDLLYYGNQRRLEYDWVLAPGADPDAIRFAVEGGRKLEVNSLGNLVLDDSRGMWLEKPTVYQDYQGSRTEIPAKYILKDNGQVGFHLGRYDASLPLVIDPILNYSTFLGGNSDDAGMGITVDSAGNAIVVGNTNSISFPTSPGSIQPYPAKDTEVFVTKLNPRGDALLFSTYLGGGGTDEATGICADESGNFYVTGKTNSADLPITQGAFQKTYGGIAKDVFVAKINASGNSLIFSTYLGSGGYDAISSIAVDSAGNSYIAGTTYFNSFPTTSGAFQKTIKGAEDIFVAKLNPMGGALTYSTFIGGSGSDQASRITVDSLGNAYITGSTNSSDFPVAPGSFQPSKGAGTSEDAFIAKLNSDGSRLLYASYLGGAGAEGAFDIAVDSFGNAYVCGLTYSQNFPVTQGAFQTKLIGTEDAFVAKVNANGTQLQYSTFMRGGGLTVALSISVNSFGQVYVSGMTQSPQYPVTPDALQQSIRGPVDIYVTVLNTEGSALSYSTLLGGSGTEYCNGMFVDGKGNIYLTGQTNSADFPMTGALQGSLKGDTDAFVLKLGAASPEVELRLSDGGVGTASTPGTADSLKSGYATATITSGTDPYGVAVFSFRQNGAIVSEAGVPASPPTKSARIFIDFRSGVNPQPARDASIGFVDTNTGIAIVNHGAQTANVTYTLRGKNGTPIIAAGSGTVEAGHHLACFIDELKNSGVPDFNLPADFQTGIQFGSLDISADQPISVLALRGTMNQRNEFLITTTPVADLTASPGNGPAYFPQFADGGGYTTSLILLNTSNVRETGKLEIKDKDGNPLTVNELGGTRDYQFNYSIEPHGWYRFQTDGFPGGTNVGWARLTPDAGTATPVGSGVFSFTKDMVLVSESGVPSASATTHARVYVDLSGNHNTGLAIANVSGTGSNIEINAYQKDGETAAGTSKQPVPLAVGGHAAAFADEFVSGLPAGFTGVLDISSAVPFAAVTLRSLDNERGDFLMTTFPVADANQTAPSPIVFPQIADGGGYVTQFILLSAGGASSITLSYYGEDGTQLAVGE